MSKEKKIEEMAKAIDSEYDCIIPCQECSYYSYKNCRDVKSAEKLYNAGYRKQSEWISVEERLPECDTNVLVITASGSFKIARVNIYKNGTVVLWATNDGLGERAITHWMPLPKAPKGGEE